MKILHTADWHLGQLFHEYDRSYEHQRFLDWLVGTLQEEGIDVLLISGDVFDLANPSAATIRQFYTFLTQASQACPDLQIVVTAGNHDSATRLEAPKPLLESSNIHIIGVVPKDERGTIDPEQLIIPLYQEGTVKAWCLAVPFLRMGDYPNIPGVANPYADGVAALYHCLFEAAKTKQQAGQAIIAMGHLHARGAEISDLDQSERLIMGGVECIAASSFPTGLAYVALGHIHKAQRLGGMDHIRYSGSPLPMSFSEIHYKHQVITFSLKEGMIQALKGMEVPVTVPLIKVPRVHRPVSEALLALDQLPNATDENPSKAPYLQVSVLLEAPEPGLRHKVEQAIVGKQVRLARIDIRYPEQKNSAERNEPVSLDKLQSLRPIDVLTKVYESKYASSVPKELTELFNEVAQQVNDEEGGEA